MMSRLFLAPLFSGSKASTCSKYDLAAGFIALLEVVHPQVAVGLHQAFAELGGLGIGCLRQLDVLLIVRLGQALLALRVALGIHRARYR